MPYEKNKTSYQDEEWFEREQRNVLDVRNWNRDLMGQTFYQICHNNKNKYRTIQFKWNPFDESLKPMISDPIVGALFWISMLIINWVYLKKCLQEQS